MFFLRKVFNFFASYGFAVVTLSFLLLLTFLGTIEQVDEGLFEVQKKYFDSLFVLHHIKGVPIPLPGVYLLMTLLFINLVCGAILRAPKDWRRPGLLISHFGIIFMIVAGFVTYEFSTNGHMTLYEGEQSDFFQSYFDWEIAIDPVASGKEYIIPGDDFESIMDATKARSFYVADLPFELKLSNFMKNAMPKNAKDMSAEAGVVPVPLEKDAERNIAGIHAAVVTADGQTLGEQTLWGMARAPWHFKANDQEYTVDLRHKQWKLPFTIVLDKFTRELHPRTGLASNFESNVTKIENGVAQKVDIKMNEPLRHNGYTFFQASWGPEDAKPGEPLYSTFAVVKNPADQWPLYSCLIVAFGLLFHFLQKLFGYLRAENRKRLAAPVQAQIKPARKRVSGKIPA